jgi:hypothetical protein
MYGTLLYNLPAAGINDVNTDMVAASDNDFSQRNNHYIFTENYRLAMAAAVGVSVTRGRYQVPTWNAIGEATIVQANRALTPPSNPQWDNYYNSPPVIPQNEEFQVQLSNNLGSATEIENVVLQILPDNWNLNLPQPAAYGVTITARATVTITPVLNGWSGPQIIAFSASLKGGTYAVIGSKMQGANAVAYRLIFPRSQLYHGRKLRPGGMVQTAIGDVQENAIPWGRQYLGVHGLFHTFEPVQVEVFGTLASSTPYQLYLDLVYLDRSVAPLDAWVAGGS